MEMRLIAKDRGNNIGLIRLIAASQVMLVHVLVWTPGTHSISIRHLSGYLPGVPIFFFLSGFLITGSWEQRPQVRFYMQRRVRRIYPALWSAVLLSTLAIFAFYAASAAQHVGTFALWLAAQATLFQSWNPEFLRGYGVGVVNGSLWTIPIEVMFYAITPLLLMLGKRMDRPIAVICAAMLISSLFYLTFTCILSPVGDTTMLVKLFTLSPLAASTWFWMFGFGMLAYLNRTVLLSFVAGRFWWFLCLYFVGVTLAQYWTVPGLLQAQGNTLGVINFLGLAGLVFSFAFNFPGLSRALTGGSDLSYGLYVYHMPVVNVAVIAGLSGDRTAALILLCVFLLAATSWYLVEQPVLQRRPAFRQLSPMG